MQRILIVKIGAIGDVAMALPMVPEIRRRWPSAHLTWVCGQVVAPLIQLCPGIDEIIVVDEEELFAKERNRRLVALTGIWRRLFLRRFDLACIGHGDWRYRLITLASIARTTHRFGDGRSGPIPGRHHSYEYVRLVTNIDGPQMPCVVMPSLAIPQIEPTLAKEAGPWVVMAPEGASNTLRTDNQRRWPLKNYAEVAARLAEQGIKVVLIGGKNDAYVRQAFQTKPVLDLIGKTSLPSLLRALQQADVVLTHDTSALHLATLTNTPLLALFGPTIMSEKLLSRKTSVGIWGGEKLPCRPCYDGKDFHPCQTVECMNDISPNLVLDKIMGLLPSQARNGVAPT